MGYAIQGVGLKKTFVNPRSIREILVRPFDKARRTEALRGVDLGIPAGRIEAFYRPPQPPAEEKDICADCRGIGYRGRTGIFELLVVDEQFRSVLANQGDLSALRQAARRAGMRSLQEEGLVLVVKGVTSLPELMRVLKENP